MGDNKYWIIDIDGTEYVSEDNSQYVLEVNPTNEIKTGDVAKFNLYDENETTDEDDSVEIEELDVMTFKKC